MLKENGGHLAYFDFWRGLAILMVVSIHCFSRINVDSHWLIEGINLCYRFVCNSAVPIFLAISGFFLAQKELSDKEKIFSFYKKRIPNVYVPMIVWSLPLLLLAIVRGEHLFMELVKTFTGAYSIYYFIILIIQCYLFLPFIKKNLYGSLFTSLVLTLVSWGFVCYALPDLPLIIYAGTLFSWGVFFVLGVFLSAHQRNYSVSLPFILIFVGIALQYVEASYLYELNGSGLGQKMSAMITSLGVVFLMFSAKVQERFSEKYWVSRIFVFLGEKSFGVYLMHCYILLLVGRFVNIHFWPMTAILVLGGTLVCMILVEHLMPSTFCRKFLGFK